MFKDFRKKFDRFCLRHHDAGIPNLMLWVIIGNLAVWFLRQIDPSDVVYSVLCFSRSAILQGQVWRLVSFIFTDLSTAAMGFGLLWELLIMYCYYTYAKVAERVWGRFRYNAFYFTGVLLLDAVGMLTGFPVSTYYLNLSLFLVIAALAPERQILIFFILPLKMKYLAWFDLALALIDAIRYLTAYGFGSFVWLVPLIPTINCALFIGANFRNLLPDFLKYRRKKTTTRSWDNTARPSANWAAGYQSKSGQKPYRHKCTVCGKTDTEYPQMEFRYCSKCSGYYCYCTDHIGNHAHIQS